jgi:hypothetical protein
MGTATALWLRNFLNMHNEIHASRDTLRFKELDIWDSIGLDLPFLPYGQFWGDYFREGTHLSEKNPPTKM